MPRQTLPVRYHTMQYRALPMRHRPYDSMNAIESRGGDVPMSMFDDEYAIVWQAGVFKILNAGAEEVQAASVGDVDNVLLETEFRLALLRSDAEVRVGREAYHVPGCEHGGLLDDFARRGTAVALGIRPCLFCLRPNGMSRAAYGLIQSRDGGYTRTNLD